MKKKIFVRAPCLSQSGYGEQSRFALRALKSREDLFDIYIQPIPWGHTGWIWKDDEFRQWMDEKILKTQLMIQKGDAPLNPDISLQITIPNEFEKMCKVNIGYTAGMETTMVAPVWLQKGNDMDKILVVSEHAKTTYEGTVAQAEDPRNPGVQFPYKLETPVEVVGEITPTADPEEIPNLDLTCEFNFLLVSQWGPRKNLPNSIKWWVEEFIDQDVGLILKGNLKNNSIMDHKRCMDMLQNILREYPDRKCKVHLLHGDLTRGQMTYLYNHEKVKALIGVAHGEGFGLPMFEAAREGLPVITHGWSGQADFLNHEGKGYFQKVNYTISPVQPEAVWENVIPKESQWAYIDQGSYKMVLRKTCKEWKAAKATANELKEIMVEKYAPTAAYERFLEQIHKDETQAVSVEDIPKISLITSVYKASEFIEQLMEDTTRQTIFKDKCEWILLNANPEGENEEEEVILKYQEKFPDNIIYKRLTTDPGIYETWNMAIKMSSGEYITNVNCDDRRVPWALEKQAKTLFMNEDADLTYADSYILQAPNQMYEDIDASTTRSYNFEKFSPEAMLRGNLPHNNPMWRQTLHETNGYFDGKYKSAGDWEFWLRCVSKGSRFIKCNETLGLYYFNPKGISTNFENFAWKQEEEKEVYTKYKEILEK